VTFTHTVEITANFEQNLEDIEAFLLKTQSPQAFDALLDELSDIVIPNLERFATIGRLFIDRSAQSVEGITADEQLAERLGTLDAHGELREYVLTHYLLLYARINSTVYLLSLRHHRQLSFDLAKIWPS